MGFFKTVGGLIGGVFGGAQKRKEAEANARIAEAQARAKQAEALAKATQSAQQQGMSDKTPWYIAGGVGALALLAILLQPKRRRR